MLIFGQQIGVLTSRTLVSHQNSAVDVMIGFVVSAALVAVLSFALQFPTFGNLYLALVESGLWLSLAFCLHFLIRQFFWRGLVPRWTGFLVPRVLVQLTGAALFMVAGGIILVRVLNLPVTGVLTTSSVFIAIVGFALRNMISDLFTGIALGIEQPFSLGDWIQLQDGTIGQVLEMNWRSTRLLTREEISIVVPNSELATTSFKNYSKPSRSWRDEFNILLDQGVTAHQAERILLSAVQQVPEIVQVDKPAEVRIVEYTSNGIVWQVRFWVPDYPKMSSLRYEVQKIVLRNMHYAGLALPASQIQLAREGEVTQDGTFRFLRGIDLFDELEDEELRQLQHTMDDRLVQAGTAVVIQGQPGASLFVVKEGLLDVNISVESDDVITVAHLVPGSFFGEMSLLTGDPRHATVTAQVDSVVVEIKKQDFEPILRARPEIAKALSEMIAQRQQRNLFRREERAEKLELGSDSILECIRNFFSLGGSAGIGAVTKLKHE